MKDRKKDHLKLCLEEDVSFEKKTTGFEKYELNHAASPGINFDDIDMSTQFLGNKLDFPINISGMVGGTERAKSINKNLSQAAENLGISMGVGSQRIAIENPNLADTFKVRNEAPSIFLIGNLGVGQLNDGYGVDEVIEAKEMIEADALALHFNPAQELFQEDGDVDFTNIIPKISEICENVDFPIIAKEVGFGFSSETARKFENAGIAAIDIQGAGGTNWIKIEKMRYKKRVPKSLEEWGIPTTQSLINLRDSVNIPLISSGGIRNGMDIAKSIILGADIAGMALPLLEPATISQYKVEEKLKNIIEELKMVMFLTGSRDIENLKTKECKSSLI
ncbi:MAG: type 2 isopentenyl-diphosphate Delta-isomerase [Candidatus Aenigmatarchaeota archaeon]